VIAAIARDRRDRIWSIDELRKTRAVARESQEVCLANHKHVAGLAEHGLQMSLTIRFSGLQPVWLQITELLADPVQGLSS